MPVISMFYGIIIRMFYYDNKEHSLPHIHIEYQDFKATLSIETSEILSGHFPPSKLKLVLAWIEIHRDELFADWKLAIEGSVVFIIDGLK
ncbi:MAG: DUF4160 domain-containing protein [Bacteroidetes bacterium]|nr:MAG: DUF4160 domain-containing protein [Bacteroidota bacterium]